MELCNDGCIPLCDFCAYYHDDSEETNGEFEGEGLCEKKDIRVDAYNHCDDDFKCFRLKGVL